MSVSGRKSFGVGWAALTLVAGCTTTVTAPPATPSWTIPAFVRNSGTCWELTAANGKDRVHLSVPASFVPDLDPLKAPGLSPGLRWTDDLRSPTYRAIGVYDVTASATSGSAEDALRWGAADFLGQAWGVVQPAVVEISEWSGVPGGRTGSQIYPTSDSTAAVARDNVFWLVPAGRSKIVVAASAPRGSAANELANQVSPTVALGACG